MDETVFCGAVIGRPSGTSCAISLLSTVPGVGRRWPQQKLNINKEIFWSGTSPNDPDVHSLTWLPIYEKSHGGFDVTLDRCVVFAEW
jgi:hypothetical protein